MGYLAIPETIVFESLPCTCLESVFFPRGTLKITKKLKSPLVPAPTPQQSLLSPLQMWISSLFSTSTWTSQSISDLLIPQVASNSLPFFSRSLNSTHHHPASYISQKLRSHLWHLNPSLHPAHQEPPQIASKIRSKPVHLFPFQRWQHLGMCKALWSSCSHL